MFGHHLIWTITSHIRHCLRSGYQHFFFFAFQGLACHLQVLALSGWLAVSLPIEYQEVTSGLHWLIPHVSTPWQDRGVIETATSDFNSSSAMLQKLIRARRRLLAVDNRLDGFKYMHRGRDLGANTTLHGPALGPGDYELYFLVLLLCLHWYFPRT